MVAYILERRMQPFADFLQLHAIKVEHLQSFTLNFGQFVKGALQAVKVDFCAYLTFEVSIACQCTFQSARLDVRAEVKSTAQQVRLPIPSPAISHLNNPHFCTSP